MTEAPPDAGRRRFLDWFLGGVLGALIAAIVYPVARFLSPPAVPEAATSRVEAGRVNDPELLEQGYKVIQFGSEPVIVIRVAEDDIRAFSATCTHLSCIVSYRQDRRLIWCYCHNGVFDLTGKNVDGPPPRPLQRYEVHLAREQGEEPPTIIVSRS